MYVLRLLPSSAFFTLNLTLDESFKAFFFGAQAKDIKVRRA